MELYLCFGFLLWVLAQITRIDESSGVKNNVLCLLLFIVLWPLIISTVVYKLIVGEENNHE